jgi:hypothetical protein
LIPLSFHDGGALNYSTAPHRSKTTLISNGVFCLLESKILSIGQTLLYSLAINKHFLTTRFYGVTAKQIVENGVKNKPIIKKKATLFMFFGGCQRPTRSFIFSRERSSTGSNDCFVVVVVLLVLLFYPLVI